MSYGLTRRIATDVIRRWNIHTTIAAAGAIANAFKRKQQIAPTQTIPPICHPRTSVSSLIAGIGSRS